MNPNSLSELKVFLFGKNFMKRSISKNMSWIKLRGILLGFSFGKKSAMEWNPYGSENESLLILQGRGNFFVATCFEMGFVFSFGFFSVNIRR